MKKTMLCILAIMLLLLFACSNDKNSTGNSNDEAVILDVSNNFIEKITIGDLLAAEQYVTSDFVWITDYDEPYVPGSGDISDLNELIEFWQEDVESIQQVTLSSNVEIDNNETSIQFTLDIWQVTTDNWIKINKEDGWKIFQFICNL